MILQHIGQQKGSYQPGEILDGIERYDNETSKSESNQKVNDKVQLSADTARSIQSQD